MRSISERVGRAIGPTSVRMRPILPLGVIAAVAALASCDKTITVPSASYPAIAATNVDANAGTWKSHAAESAARWLDSDTVMPILSARQVPRESL